MSLPEIVSRQDWLAARRQLLASEKELTRRRDAVNADRRRLPMVRVGKQYNFEGPDGVTTLAGLMGESQQLVVQHVMFDPAWEKPCPGCTASLDELAPAVLVHMKTRGTAFAAVSRAPYPKIVGCRQQRGWTFPWYSSHGSDFNYDFHVTADAAVAPVEYNYRSQDELARNDPDWLDPGPSELPGFSCFLRDGDSIYHTYSAYARGTEQAAGAYGLLDLTALGRSEEWEQPAGRAATLRKADPSFG